MTTQPQGMRFLVHRDALAETRVEDINVDAPLQPGVVRVRIEHFAFTANNITYAKFGESMHYWRFFPAGDGWGCIPVWGFGSVEASAAEGVAVAERLYGYWPMASHAMLHPTAVGRLGFSDGSVQRIDLPAVYNHYRRVSVRDPCCCPAPRARPPTRRRSAWRAGRRPAWNVRGSWA